MMKKVILTLALLMLAVTPAMAFDLGGYVGEFQFKYNNWDYGTLYMPGTSFDNGGQGTGATNSYGIFQVTSVQGRDSGGSWYDVWTPTTNEKLVGWFYGLSDDKVNIAAAGNGTIYSVGGKIEMYLVSNSITPNAGPGVVPALGSAPTDIWGVDDGTLFLSANFVPGIVLGDATTTYAQQVNAITQPISGHGDAYLSLTGGSHMGDFDTNGYLGGNADLLLGANFFGGMPTAEYGWTATSFDPVKGTVTPEPASMVLLSLGLAGLARLRRKV